MVHFPGLARTSLCIQPAVSEFYSEGFPHSDIPGSKPACGSPRLFAACHVLHRLLAPRHPPYALSSLTIKLTQAVTIRSALSQNGRPEPFPAGNPPASNSVWRRGKFAFAQIALLEQNLQISHHVVQSCECKTLYHRAANTV